MASPKKAKPRTTKSKAKPKAKPKYRWATPPTVPDLILTLPAEMLMKILSFLPADSTIPIYTSCQYFHQFMNESFWKRLALSDPAIGSKWISDLSYPRYIRISSGNKCEMCLTSTTQRIRWALKIKICRRCEIEKTTNDVPDFVMMPYPYFLPNPNRPTRFYWTHDLVHANQVNKLRAPTKHFYPECDAVAERKVAAFLAECNHQVRQDQRRKVGKAIIQDARKTQVLIRFTDAYGDSLNIQALKKTKMYKSVVCNDTRKITDDLWRQLFPKFDEEYQDQIKT